MGCSGSKSSKAFADKYRTLEELRAGEFQGQQGSNGQRPPNAQPQPPCLRAWPVIFFATRAPALRLFGPHAGMREANLEDSDMIVAIDMTRSNEASMGEPEQKLQG